MQTITSLAPRRPCHASCLVSSPLPPDLLRRHRNHKDLCANFVANPLRCPYQASHTKLVLRAFKRAPSNPRNCERMRVESEAANSKIKRLSLTCQDQDLALAPYRSGRTWPLHFVSFAGGLTDFNPAGRGSRWERLRLRMIHIEMQRSLSRMRNRYCLVWANHQHIA